MCIRIIFSSLKINPKAFCSIEITSKKGVFKENYSESCFLYVSRFRNSFRLLRILLFLRKVTPNGIFSLKTYSEWLRKSCFAGKSARILIFSHGKRFQITFSWEKSYSENYIFFKNNSETCFRPRNCLQNSFFVVVDPFSHQLWVMLSICSSLLGLFWSCHHLFLSLRRKKNIHLHPERASKRKLINLECNFMKK